MRMHIKEELLMNVHTLQFAYRTYCDDYIKIYNDCIKYCRVHRKSIYKEDEKFKNRIKIIEEQLATNSKKYKRSICEALTDIGITILFINYVKAQTVYFGLKIILNPIKLINKDDNIDILNYKELPKVISIFNKELNNLSEAFPKFNEFSLSRIDYTYNYYFDNQDMAGSAMDIFKRAYQSKNLSEYKEFDKIQKRYVSPKDSIYIKNNSVTINIYLKYNEIINKKKDFKDKDKALGLMRFEIQCKQSKVYNIRKKYNMETLNPINFFDEEVYRYIFTSYFKKIFGTGYLYKYKTAVNKINNSKITKKRKDILLKFLEICNEKRNINKAIDEFIKLKYTKNKIQMILKLFNSINVNPITIPRRHEFNQLKNPINLIFDENI